MVRILLLIALLAVPSGDTIPDFRLPDLDGREQRISDLMGEQLTLIDFWATWCAPCVKSIPSMVSIADEFSGDGVAVVGISVDSPRNTAKVEPFARSLGVEYPILLDATSEVMADLNVVAVPTLLIVNADREVVYVHEGFRSGDEDVVREEVIRLLKDEE